jgi:[protein-PII] uridylyltransferase
VSHGTLHAPGGSIVDRLRAELSALDRAYSAGHHGLWSARRRTEAVDAAILELFESAVPPRAVAVAAVGGYGRSQQLPCSDIDLLFVHDGRDPGAVAAMAGRLLYPLWDGGFEVGHAIRTREESVDLAGRRLDALTAMLDLRVIAGEASLADGTADAVASLAREDPAGLAERLHADRRAREERFGSAAHLMEPDLKSGTGGLRDIQAIRWLVRVTGVELLRPPDAAALDEAEEFLTRARSALHLETGRRADRLPRDLQSSIAGDMGFVDAPRLIADDALMRTVFEHARSVRWVGDGVFDRIARSREGTTGDPSILTPIRGAADVLGALAAEAEADRRPPLEVLDAIDAPSVETPVAWNDEVRAGFLRILRAGDVGLHALEAMDRLGLLVRLIPAWADVRCRPQRDPYHRLTVDTHLTATLARVVRSVRSPDHGDPLAVDAAERLAPALDGIALGALLHDIGKAGEGGHVGIGAAVADGTLARMGIPDEPRTLASFMVANHLLLPDTATRRDLSDEHLVLQVAAAVGSPDRLAALYLLAAADAEATGPAAWTPWRQTLIRELVGKVQRVFERGDMGPELAERLGGRVGRLRELLADRPEEAVDRFVLDMPQGYFLTVEPEEAARHFATVSPALGTSEVRSAATRSAKPDTYEVLVVATDRPGLLSWIAGSFALSGLSIRTAQVFTTDQGAAVDLFEVQGTFEPEVSEARWRSFRGTLRAAVEGRISLERRVAEVQRHDPALDHEAPITVMVDNEASDFSTVIEVGAPDRPGLLYDITSALADLRLDVHLAKVATYTGRVIDAFYVRDALGSKVTGAEQISEVETAISERLEG